MGTASSSGAGSVAAVMMSSSASSPRMRSCRLPDSCVERRRKKDVQLAAVQVVQKVLRGTETDVELDLGIAGVVRLQIMQGIGHGGVDDADVDAPALAGADAADILLHAPEIEEKRAALAVERLSGLGELHAAALAGEKLYTELGFKLGDLSRDGRLGDVQGAAAAEMLRPSATAQKYSSWRMVMEMRLLTSYTKKV